MMNSELYQTKYKYERLLKQMNVTIIRLEKCYSNLVLCKKKIANCLYIDNNYYEHNNYEQIISNINNSIKIIKNVIIPEAKYEYNKILLKISNL